ncbi:hypothetical protein LMG7141_02730 [Ralstonia condita]|uniref:ApeA N-terminal domain-containing protein n=1 Tax=Ralstonia condita TaxID=3058600 RepID=A0ABM9JG63_9RALS|nr:hypothetical protein [Ralstonia sp. LMG 7141]CAJ0792947.1 hypothetical protein LMG7141_02730 [Ralstonia sp. LMG 7141]
MDYQEWEFFETEVKSDVYTVVDHGPLHGPVTSFVVKRDNRLNLVLESTSAANSPARGCEPVANAVRRPDGQVHCQSRYTDSTVTARGITPRGYSLTFPVAATADAAAGTRVQTSLIESLDWESSHSGEASCVMDWIENLSGSFLWPDSDNVEETDAKSRTLRSASGDIVIPLTTTSSKHSNSCARLSIGGWDVIIGESRAKPEHIKNPGFILYLGLPTEEIRSRIRGCLSYCLGDYFVYLGSTTFDAEWKPVSFRAVAAHALVENAHDISGRPPAPLGLRYDRDVNAALLSRMASGLFAAYEAYNLRTAFWNYWHAAAAPVHMVAAHFGAAIEALQRAYFSNTAVEAHTRIVAEEAWRGLYAQIDRCIQDSALSSEQKRMLGNKAQHLNSAPQAVLADRFFTAIGLEISALEKDVWMNRNRAAHGGGITEERGIQTVRENKVLMMLMNRILLSISGASDLYYDYYTLNRPTRRLLEPVPDDRPPRAR